MKNFALSFIYIATRISDLNIHYNSIYVLCKYCKRTARGLLATLRKLARVPLAIPSATIHRDQTQKPTSHPAVSPLKICISSKRLRSEARKKALLEIQ